MEKLTKQEKDLMQLLLRREFDISCNPEIISISKKLKLPEKFVIEMELDLIFENQNKYSYE